MIVLTERTPNPEAMKFLPQARLTDGASFAFLREEFEAESSPLAARLFALPDVGRVYIAADFLTVTRRPDGESWADLRLPVVAAVAEHLASGEPAVRAEVRPPPPTGDEAQIEFEIREVLARHVQPGVARDGGEILFERFEPATGVLWIRMQGACGGCPSSRLTLKAGVEAIVRRYVPEVLRVEEAVADVPGNPAEPAASGRLKAWLARFGDRPAVPVPRTRFTHAGRPMAERDKAAS